MDKVGGRLQFTRVIAYAGRSDRRILLFWALALSAGPRTPGWALAAVAFALAVLYGVGDELHQTFVAGRTASEADLGLDAAGAAMGITLALLCDRLLTARHERR